MTPQLQTTSIIRQRGQLTIPDSFRKFRKWTRPGSVVKIYSNKLKEIIIQPIDTQITNWDKLWKNIKKTRSYKGNGSGNLSKFIAQDRQKH